MHIRHETIVHGETLAEITVAATHVWREFIADPTAELPWNAEMIIEEADLETTLDGTVVKRRYRAQVRVTTDPTPTHTSAPPSTA